MRPQGESEPASIVVKTYDLELWLIPKAEKFVEQATARWIDKRHTLSSNKRDGRVGIRL